MGQVRFVQRGAVEQQLAAGNIVLLTNIGVGSAGELLNCNAFDVSAATCCCAPACCISSNRCCGRLLASQLRLGCTYRHGIATAMPAAAAAHPKLPPPPFSPFHFAQQVATHAAVELRADKLLVITGRDVRQLDLPHYLPLVRGG